MRESDGKFTKGVSGNPGGRPKSTQEQLDFIDSCKKMSTEALATLKKWMDNEQQPNASVKAATLILAYAWGQPTQKVEADVDTNIKSVISDKPLTEDEFRAKYKLK